MTNVIGAGLGRNLSGGLYGGVEHRLGLSWQCKEQDGYTVWGGPCLSPWPPQATLGRWGTWHQWRAVCTAELTLTLISVPVQRNSGRAFALWQIQVLRLGVGWEGAAVGRTGARGGRGGCCPVRGWTWAAQNCTIMGKHKNFNIKLTFSNMKVVIVKFEHKRKFIRKMKFLFNSAHLSEK